jgi:hypothetical protein
MRRFRSIRFATKAFIGLMPIATFAAQALVIPSPVSAGMIAYSATGNQLPADPIRYVDTSNLTGPATTPTVANGMATLGATSMAGYSFWYTDNLLLDHTQTVDVIAQLRLDSENSTDPTDRSGLAIAITDDRDLYQDLFIDPTEAFFDKIDSTGTQRVRDSSVSLDATQFHTYDLRLAGNTVTLLVDSTPTISSNLFNVAQTGDFELPDYAAVGDISTSAQSQFDLKSFTVSVVPEPAYGAIVFFLLTSIIAFHVAKSCVFKRIGNADPV